MVLAIAQHYEIGKLQNIRAILNRLIRQFISFVNSCNRDRYHQYHLNVSSTKLKTSKFLIFCFAPLTA